MVVHAGKHKCCGDMNGPRTPRAAADSSRLPDLPSDLNAWRLLQECAQTSHVAKRTTHLCSSVSKCLLPVPKRPMFYA